MEFKSLIPALKAACIHLVGSAAVALVCVVLVFGLWYPPPFDVLAAGRELIFLIVVVDVTCGPLLTLVVFNPQKSAGELWRDMGLIVFLQSLALVYGLVCMAEARPVWLAFEGDRFRVVSVPDIEKKSLYQAPEELRNLSLSGPKLIGIRLIKNDDPEFPKSIQLAMQGVPPAFRPARWVPYKYQDKAVIAAAGSLKNLYAKHPDKKNILDKGIQNTGLRSDQLGYLPLASEGSNEWVVLIDLTDALPKAYLPIDAW